MKLRTLLVAVALAGGFSFVAGPAWSQEKDPAGQEKKEKKKRKKDKKEKPSEEAKAAPGDLDPTMAAWIKAGAPGEHHKVLEPLAGEWTTAGTFSPAPGAPTTESKGTCKRKSILGGRFIQEEFKGDFLGMPMEGIGFMGYDNLKKKYVNSWMDTMSSPIMISLGTMDDSKKEITLVGEYDDPLTGKVKKNRSIFKIDSKDKNTWTMFDTGPDGKEFKSMEIVYTRK